MSLRVNTSSAHNEQNDSALPLISIAKVAEEKLWNRNTQ
jgi:hypothetical protein